MPGKFSYKGLFSKNSTETARAAPRRPKYDFGVAYPDPATLPLDGLVEGLKKGLEREGRDLSYYPHPQGSPALRELVQEKLARDRGIKASVDQIVLTQGSGESIGMIIQALTDPGDTVLTEEFVYVGTLRQLKRFGAKVIGVKVDDDGIIPEELEKTLAELASRGVRPKYLYTIPVFQNPTGSDISRQRRQRILSITEKYGVPIFEDDCYVDLRFEGEQAPSYYSMDNTGRVLYVGSFSKIIAPGMRMGYMVAPDEVVSRAMSFKTGGGASQFVALAIEGYLKGHLDEHINEITQALQVKRDAMLAALGENFGSTAQWSKPKGGLYIWFRLPEGVDLAALQEPAFQEAGIAYIAGNAFSPDDKGRNYARLCFGHPTPERVREGIAALARFLESKGALKG